MTDGNRLPGRPAFGPRRDVSRLYQPLQVTDPSPLSVVERLDEDLVDTPRCAFTRWRVGLLRVAAGPGGDSRNRRPTAAACGTKTLFCRFRRDALQPTSQRPRQAPAPLDRRATRAPAVTRRDPYDAIASQDAGEPFEPIEFCDLSMDMPVEYSARGWAGDVAAEVECA